MTLMIINLVELSQAFSDGSRQTEKTTQEQFDRYSSDAYHLDQNGFEIAAFVRMGAERYSKDQDGNDNAFFKAYQ